MSCSRTPHGAASGMEPRTSRFGVRRSTTTPPRSLKYDFKIKGCRNNLAYGMMLFAHFFSLFMVLNYSIILKGFTVCFYIVFMLFTM